MKAKQLILLGAGLIFFLFLLPKAASARINFHIGFGTGISHGYSHVHGGFHYGLHDGYHRWPGRRHKVFGHRHSHRHKPWHSSGVSVWIGGLFPMVIKPPVVVKAPKVITESRVIVEEPECQTKLDDNITAELFEKLRRRKSELLKKLRIGGKVKRKESIRELAGFSFDNTVREALENVLLSEPDPELRRQVAESFGKTTNKKVLPALEKAKADDPNIEIRQEAHEAIIKIRGYKL